MDVLRKRNSTATKPRFVPYELKPFDEDEDVSTQLTFVLPIGDHLEQGEKKNSCKGGIEKKHRFRRLQATTVNVQRQGDLDGNRTLDDVVLRFQVLVQNLFFLENLVLLAQGALAVAPLAGHVSPQHANLDARDILPLFPFEDNRLERSLRVLGRHEQNQRGAARNDAILAVHGLPAVDDAVKGSRDAAVRADLGAPAEEEESGSGRNRADVVPLAVHEELEPRFVGEDERVRAEITVFAAPRRNGGLRTSVVVDHAEVHGSVNGYGRRSSSLEQR